jgi:hypothetical protein
MIIKLRQPRSSLQRLYAVLHFSVIGRIDRTNQKLPDYDWGAALTPPVTQRSAFTEHDMRYPLISNDVVRISISQIVLCHEWLQNCSGRLR